MAEFSIHGVQFLGMESMWGRGGAPLLPHEMIEDVQRPGVDGTGFVLMGSKGFRFPMRAWVDGPDEPTAQLFVRGCRNLVGIGPVNALLHQTMIALLRKKGAEPLAFEVTRRAATERAFTGKYEHVWADGSYHCICCDAKLFDANTKFDAGCGWPSFDQSITENAVETRTDRTHGMVRTEVRSKKSNSHLGHVFSDGPEPTGLRYCINSASLRFIPKEKLCPKP